MEHRYSPRLSTPLKVLIYQRSLPVAIGHLRNVGRHGMLIDSAYTDIALNQPMEIEVLTRNRRNAHLRYKMRVMHKMAGAFGLAVDDRCVASCDRLATLLTNFRYRQGVEQMQSKVE